jgi:IS5 family transposase
VRGGILSAPTSLASNLADQVAQPHGEAGCEWLLSVIIQVGVASQTVKPNDFHSVTVDTTVQEKAITYPTDGKLYERCRQHLIRLADQNGIKLRQNYNRKAAPYLLLMANRYHHAKHMKQDFYTASLPMNNYM